MTAIKITAFGGMTPALDARLLPENAAAYAEDTWLRDGRARGQRPETQVRNLANPAATKVFRIPGNVTQAPAASFANSTWMEFEDFDTDVLKTPVIGDTYRRYYWASPSTEPRYNTQTRIQDGFASFKLGIPAPVGVITVASGGGTSATTSTRAYLYTYVSEYGEEGPPSTATLDTGLIDDTYTLTVPNPSSGVTDERNLTHKRIYRTVTSDSGTATYFLVGTITISTTSYVDTDSDATVAQNAQLDSTGWDPPPSTLAGIVQLPNGIMAGWSGQDIYFSEPYRPHAWPTNYILTVDAPVVGLGVWGQSLAVLTNGYPTIITGVHPAQMSQFTIPIAEPCTIRSSIVSTPEGVVYASPNGLMSVNTGGVRNVTSQVITTEQWMNDVSPYVLRAARHRTAYIAARTDGEEGFLLDGGLPGFCWLNNYPCFNDVWTGEVFQVHASKVYWFNPPVTTSMSPYLWRSKVFAFPEHENLGVAKINFIIPDGSPTLNGTPNTSLVQTLAADQYGLFRVYADGELVYTRELRESGQIFRLASGFMATEWQFEIEARVEVTYMEIASSAGELTKI